MKTNEQYPPGQKSTTFNSLSALSVLLDTPEQEQTPTPLPPPTSYTQYHNMTYSVVALMMYLIGVDERHFSSHNPDLSDVYQKYHKDPRARVIRNLCVIRTALEKNFLKIADAFLYDLRNLSTLPEYIPSQAVMELQADGVSLQKSKPDINNYIIAINKELSNRINNVRPLFPEWLKWEYIRPLFIMPGGTKVEGIKQAGNFYNSNRNRYPYQCYMNWDKDDCGNLLLCDEKFVRLLYERYEDAFEDRSLVRDVGNQVMDDLYSFLSRNKRTLMVVDCENSDPIKLAAALTSLSRAQKDTIQKILLFDSDYTTTVWTTLCQTGITELFSTERVVVPRLYEHKSQVDMTLAVSTCREVYQNGIDSVLLVSSDSDYWALMRSLPDIRFLVMLEKEKSGRTIRDALESEGYHYCFIDDFCTGASYAIKTGTLLSELQRRVDEKACFNVNEMLDDVLHSTWIQMTDKERLLFFDRHLKTMRLRIDSDGNVRVEFGDG